MVGRADRQDDVDRRVIEIEGGERPHAAVAEARERRSLADADAEAERANAHRLRPRLVFGEQRVAKTDAIASASPFAASIFSPIMLPDSSTLTTIGPMATGVRRMRRYESERRCVSRAIASSSSSGTAPAMSDDSTGNSRARSPDSSTP